MPPLPPLHFGTKIRFISPETLQANKPSSIDMVANWPFIINDRVSLQRKAYTEGAFNCNIITLHNGAKGTCAHLSPYDVFEKRDKITEGLKEDIKKLRQNSSNPIQAFITGGFHFKHETSKESKQLFGVLRKIVKEAGIPQLSIIWGLRVDNPKGVGLFCHPQKDEILISNSAVSPTQEGIKEAFRIIHIAEGDTFEIDPEIEVARDPMDTHSEEWV